jgi:tetratricopeptide (TPR) repeat protein
MSMVLTACASTGKRPTEQLAHASESIEAAEQSGGREYGPVALESAQTKLMLAKVASERGSHEEALQLAREAEIEAELAAAQASRGKAEDALEELDGSIRTLREEIERNQSKEES